MTWEHEAEWRDQVQRYDASTQRALLRIGAALGDAHIEYCGPDLITTLKRFLDSVEEVRTVCLTKGMSSRAFFLVAHLLAAACLRWFGEHRNGHTVPGTGIDTFGPGS